MNSKFFLPFAIIILSLMTVMGFFLLRSKNLRMHPYPLYAFEVLACVFFFWNWYVYNFVMTIAINFVEILPFFWINRRNELIFRLTVFFEIQNQFFEQQFYTLYPLFNFLLFVDLWWITKNPFYPQRWRNFYYAIPILVMILVSIAEFVVTI